MSKINRYKPGSGHKRPLARNHKATAKAQAYIFRDLIEKHSGIRLKGGDVTDSFALTYHYADWAELMAGLTPGENGNYYATPERDLVNQRASVLRQLIPSIEQRAVRVVLDMPARHYEQCRSIQGAYLCTLLGGGPSWKLMDWSQARTSSGEALMFHDARTARAYIPLGFSSDPMTNAECVRGLDSITGEEECIPVEQVRYTALGVKDGGNGEALPVGEFVSHTTDAHRFALSQQLAGHWYGTGNAVKVINLNSVHNAGAQLISKGGPDGTESFDQQLQRHIDKAGAGDYLLLPEGIDEVRDPEERWKPSMRRSLALLPKVEAADAAYQMTLNTISSSDSGAQAEAVIREATRLYNETLLLALEAFWRDTREINGKAILEQSFKSQDLDNELCFASVGPLVVLRRLLFGRERKSEGAD